MNKKIKLFILLIASLNLLACSGSSAPTTIPGVNGTGGGGGGATGSNSPLEVSLNINYIGSSNRTLVGECLIPPGTAPGSAGAYETCFMRIPELNLYFSQFRFRVATNNADVCKQIVFMPYNFTRSTSATFTNDLDGSDIDCTLPDPYCFGGAAKFVTELTGFPLNRGLYYLTANKLSSEYNMLSLDENRASDAHRSMRNNSNYTNNLITRNANINNQHINYVANTMTDYTFQCRNDWGEVLYEWILVLSDDDLIDTETNLPFDTFWDWGGL